MDNKKKTIATAYQVKLSQNAIRNIDEITGYIAFINLQPINAIKVGDAIFDTIDKIQQNPYRYKECLLLPTKNKIYRQVLCKSWYIIYKIIDTEITILGIIHSSRKPSAIRSIRKFGKL